MKGVKRKKILFSMLFIVILPFSILSEDSLSSNKANLIKKNHPTLPSLGTVKSLSTKKSLEVNSISDEGKNLTSYDKINTFQYENMSLNSSNSRTNSFVIEQIADFPNEELSLLIEKIKGVRDYYIIEAGDLKSNAILSYANYITLAQEFEVYWDYSMFYGVNMTLEVNYGTGLGNNSLELFVVKANQTGYPDMNHILTEAKSSPFNESNYNLLGGSFSYYEFNPSLLEKGHYFLVANLSIIDNTSDSSFIWKGKKATDNGKALFSEENGHWQSFADAFDLSLILDFCPTDENGKELLFINPSELDMQVNGVKVSTLNSPITNSGLQVITVNTSIFLELNNSYFFYREFEAISQYSVTNNSDNREINWKVFWELPSANASPYLQFRRVVEVFAQKDWVSSDAYTIMNNSLHLTSQKVNNNYKIWLNNTMSAANFTLYTVSPNYINNLTIISSDQKEVNLGYWEKVDEFFYGYEGSNLNISTILLNNESTGTINFTLFNSKEEISPIKENLSSLIKYLDNSSYSKFGVFNVFNNQFYTNITLDPSFENSDCPGEWTLFVYWKNGTEVGFLTRSIIVKAYTKMESVWKVKSSSENWTNDSVVEQFSGEVLSIKCWIYSLSNLNSSFTFPYIKNEKVIFSTSWMIEGAFIYSNNYYFANVSLEAPAGIQSIDVNFNSMYFHNQSKSIYLRIFYKMSFSLISPQENQINVNQDLVTNITFKVTNETNINKNTIPIFNDDVVLKMNEITVLTEYYTIVNTGENTTISLNISKLGIQAGNFTLNLEINKESFKFNDSSLGIIFSFKLIVNSVSPTTPHLPKPDGRNQFLFLERMLIFVILPILTASISFLVFYFFVIRRKKIREFYISTYKDYLKINSIKKIIFVHQETSISIFELNLGSDFQRDSSLISGFFQAISTIGNELTEKGSGDIRKIQYQNFVVTSARTDHYVIYVFSENDITSDIDLSIQSIILWFEANFNSYAEGWNGDPSVFNGKREEIMEKCTSFLYLWMKHPIKLNVPKRTKKSKYIEKQLRKYLETDNFFFIEELVSKIENDVEKGKILFYLKSFYDLGYLEIKKEYNN